MKPQNIIYEIIIVIIGFAHVCMPTRIVFENEVHVNTTTTAYVTIRTGGNDEVKRKKLMWHLILLLCLKANITKM